MEVAGKSWVAWYIYNKRQMSSNMGENQHSAFSFRREWTENISGEKYRLLLLLVW